MAHLAHENCHAGTNIIEIKIECHLVTLCVQYVDVFLYLLARDEKIVKFPFYTHEKHTVLTIYILVKIYNVAFIVGDEFCHL